MSWGNDDFSIVQVVSERAAAEIRQIFSVYRYGLLLENDNHRRARQIRPA
jgi:hypothetical protein